MSPSIFDFNDQTVRVIMRGETPWFCAKDVCAVLGYSKYRDALANAELDADERVSTRVDTPGGPQEMVCVDESGLYVLVLGSRKPVVRRFRKWVTAEVLPAIRRRGRYEMEEAMRASERGRLGKLRSLLLDAGAGVLSRKVTPGQAQAIALTAQRYLETLKVEGEALGYEKVLGLPDGEGSDGLLPPRRKTAELLQDVPQPPLPRAPQDEPGLPDGSAEMQAALGGEASGQTGCLREGAQGEGEADLSAIGYDPVNPH